MPTVGRTLASERTRQRLDLEDVERATKIPLRSLKSIENDDFNQLPGVVFARNFVRQYAEFLRLDSTSIGHQFDSEQRIAEPAFVMPPQRFKVPSMGGSAFSKVADSNTISAFITFVLTILVCAAVYYAYLFVRDRSAERASAAPPATAAPVAGRSIPPKQPAPSPTTGVPAETTPTGANPATPPLPETPASPVHVQISAEDACWARITADGTLLFAGTLNAGEERDVDASESVIVRAGNAGALTLKLNGNDVPPIGPKGQIRTVTLTPTGAQVRAPDPEGLPPA